VSDAWQYQLRIYLRDELVETARFRANDPALGQLLQILQKHSATMKCQFDAFAEYVRGRELSMHAKPEHRILLGPFFESSDDSNAQH